MHYCIMLVAPDNATTSLNRPYISHLHCYDDGYQIVGQLAAIWHKKPDLKPAHWTALFHSFSSDLF